MQWIQNTVRMVSVQKLNLLSVWKIERDLLMESSSNQQEIRSLITAYHLCPSWYNKRQDRVNTWEALVLGTHLGGSSLTIWWGECRFHSSLSQVSALLQNHCSWWPWLMGLQHPSSFIAFVYLLISTENDCGLHVNLYITFSSIK